MLIALIIVVGVGVPLILGAVAGLRVKAGPSYRQAPIVAWICTLALLAPVLIAVDAATPQSACGNTGCDTANGMGMMFLSIPVFAITLVGVALGRWRVRSRKQQHARPQ